MGAGRNDSYMTVTEFCCTMPQPDGRTFQASLGFEYSAFRVEAPPVGAVLSLDGGEVVVKAVRSDEETSEDGRKILWHTVEVG